MMSAMLSFFMHEPGDFLSSFLVYIWPIVMHKVLTHWTHRNDLPIIL
jgi:hypothetical protein